MMDGMEFLVTVVFSAPQVVLLLRFLGQITGISPVNPVMQWLIQVSGSLTKPFEQRFSPHGNINWILLVLALGLAMLQMVLVAALDPNFSMGIVDLLRLSILSLTRLLLLTYQTMLLIYVLSSWFYQGGYNPALTFITTLIEPILMPLRRAIPALSGIDFSPVIFLLLIEVLKRFLGI